MKKLTKPLLLVGLLAGASVAAFAVADSPGQPGKAGPGRPPGQADNAAPGEQKGPRWGHRRGLHGSFAERLSRHGAELGITAQQLEAIRGAEQAARPEMEKLFQTVRDQRDAERAGKGNTEQLAAAHKALHARREALRTQIDGILTAEQRTKLQEMRGKMQGKHGRRGHKGPPAPEDTTTGAR